MDENSKKYMFKNELRVELRSRRNLFAIIMCNLLLFVCIAYYFNMIFRGTTKGYTDDYKLVLNMYNTLLAIEYIVVLCFVPFTTATTLARDYETNTLDLLLLTRLNTADIISIKLKQIVCVYFVFVISTLPLLCVVFSVGVVNIFHLILYILVILSSVICYSCVGLYISVKTRRVMVSALITAMIELLTIWGNYVLIGFVYNTVDRINNAKNEVMTVTQMEYLGDLLITNPLISIFKLQSMIEGSSSTFNTLMYRYGVLDIVDILWIPLSIALQLLVSVILVGRVKKIMYKRHYK